MAAAGCCLYASVGISLPRVIRDACDRKLLSGDDEEHAEGFKKSYHNFFVSSVDNAIVKYADKVVPNPSTEKENNDFYGNKEMVCTVTYTMPLVSGIKITLRAILSNIEVSRARCRCQRLAHERIQCKRTSLRNDEQVARIIRTRLCGEWHVLGAPGRQVFDYELCKRTEVSKQVKLNQTNQQKKEPCDQCRIHLYLSHCSPPTLSLDCYDSNIFLAIKRGGPSSSSSRLLTMILGIVRDTNQSDIDRSYLSCQKPPLPSFSTSYPAVDQAHHPPTVIPSAKTSCYALERVSYYKLPRHLGTVRDIQARRPDYIDHIRFNAFRDGDQVLLRGGSRIRGIRLGRYKTGRRIAVEYV